MESKTYPILFLTIVLAFVLRFVQLENIPPSLNWDEVSHGFNAYSVLKTGSDEWGQALPIFNFRAYGDYPLPLNLYITIPFIIIFGLSEFSIRFPHVILGTLTTVSAFFLAYGLTRNNRIAILTAFLTAISPWTLFTSRFVLQSNISVFLLTTSLALFFNRDRSSKLVTLSLISLGLSLYAYHTTRIISPFVLLGFLIIHKEILKHKLNILIISLLFIPIPFILLGNDARARSFAVGIIDEGTVARIEELRNNSKLSKLATKFLYNKPVYFLKEFSKNYISYFSPQFLFLKGGTQYQFSLPEHGLLYWINLPLFYIGLYSLLKKSVSGDKNYLLLLLVLLLAPIPAAITSEKFAVLRSSAMIPAPMLLIAMGIGKLSEIKKIILSPSILISTFVILNLLFLENYWLTYSNDYGRKYSQSWQYGYKEVASYIQQNSDKYAKIIMTKKYGEPHEFLLFHLKYDPQEYKSDKNLNRFYQSNWWWVDSFGKFYFINDWDIPKTVNNRFIQESKKTVDCRQAKCLLITSPGNVPEGWNIIKTINFVDGSPAFELYGNN